MIPYIAVLILLIAVILYQVYTSEEYFTNRDASGNLILVPMRDASGNPIVVPLRDPRGDPLAPITNRNTVSTTASTNPLLTGGSGNSASTKDASGNDIKISVSDLFGLLGPFKMADASGNSIKAAAPAETKPTTASTKEIEERIAKTVSKQIKDDLMSQRATDDVHDKYAPCDLTDAEAQGQEYGSAKPSVGPSQPTQPSQQPDMSEYIRKDSIPCWNCAVP